MALRDRILEIGFGCGADICQVSALATHGFVAGIDRKAAKPAVELILRLIAQVH